MLYIALKFQLHFVLPSLWKLWMFSYCIDDVKTSSSRSDIERDLDNGLDFHIYSRSVWHIYRMDDKWQHTSNAWRDERRRACVGTHEKSGDTIMCLKRKKHVQLFPARSTGLSRTAWRTSTATWHLVTVSKREGASIKHIGAAFVEGTFLLLLLLLLSSDMSTTPEN